MDPANVAATRARLEQMQQEQAQLQAQLAVSEYASKYEVNLQFPAVVSGNRRTNDELIQHRLLEAGLLYDVPTSIAEIMTVTSSAVADLERTGCFQAVAVEIGAGDDETNRQLKVVLEEANWYRIHAGGGVKTDTLFHPEQQAGFLPSAEFEASIGLRNLSGYLDQTRLQYTLDTRSLATWSLDYERPLYSLLPSLARDAILGLATGSQYSFQARASTLTEDYEWTRSYQEFHRRLSLQIANVHSYVAGEQAPSSYASIEWLLDARDIVPRRHAKLPLALAASSAVASQAGPNVKHSVKIELRTNGEYVDHGLLPAQGVQASAVAEVALPPGDIGFAKAQTSVSIHYPLSSSLSIHGALSMGYLHPLLFGGLCRPPTISDRFFVGGPMQLRGFGPAGIGPRATTSTTNSPGDALGGDFYYTATAMASLVPSVLKPVLHDAADAVRIFGFCNIGTSVGTLSCTDAWSVLQSTRACVGVGLASAALGPRIEVTYGWPIRYGPRDVRRHFQFGMGFTFG